MGEIRVCPTALLQGVCELVVDLRMLRQFRVQGFVRRPHPDGAGCPRRVVPVVPRHVQRV
eukprot:12619104-Alexandrium_andersonii.AAC.1